MPWCPGAIQSMWTLTWTRLRLSSFSLTLPTGRDLEPRSPAQWTSGEGEGHRPVRRLVLRRSVPWQVDAEQQLRVHPECEPTSGHGALEAARRVPHRRHEHECRSERSRDVAQGDVALLAVLRFLELSAAAPRC